MKKIDLTVDNRIIKDVYVAKTFYERFKGLMFVSKQNSFNLLIENCNSVHTCFMKFDIDVYCLDKDYGIIKIYNNVKPFRFILPAKKVCNILEIPTVNIKSVL